MQQRGQLPRRGARREQRAQLGVHAREERAQEREVRRRARRAGRLRRGGGAEPGVELDGGDGAALRVERDGQLEVLAEGERALLSV